MVSGYGYRPLRAFGAYALVIAFFTALYLICTTMLHQLQLGRFLRLEEQSDLTRRMKRYEPEPA
jgi:hypothetical protein